jgi:hypothetical protein
MAKRLRYSGEFLSINGDVWRCEILQEAAQDYPSVGDLVFPADEPLSIEWDERSPEEPVCGSMATLTIESPGDRTYADLYTEEPGAIRLDVYKNDVLYWSGCLDTETYHEPYDRYDHYDVELTFYDFGHLGRIPYDLTGTKTLLQIVQGALAATGISYTAIDETYESTKFTDNTAVTLAALSIPSENFIDEDGIAMDWEKVLEGILQPLGLRIVQRAGKIWVYDLNGLYTLKNGTVQVSWDGVGQSMDVGQVFNNLRITFSPYSGAELLPEFKYGDTADPALTNLTTTAGNPERYSFYADYDPAHRVGYSWDYDNIDFTIFLSNDSTKCTGLASKGSSNRYFKIVPLLGGSEAEGVAVGFRKNQHSNMTQSTPIAGINPGSHPQSVAFTTKRMYLPPLSSDDQEQNYIRIVMEMLCDPRYNPFEDAPEDGEGNENANYADFLSWAQQAFVSVAIVLYDANGTALYHYTNSSITSHGSPANTVAGCARRKSGNTTIDGWVSGDASFGDAWLSYYDTDLDIVEGQGCLGFKANRQNFGKPWAEGRKASKRKKYYKDLSNNTQDWWFFESFKRVPDGQFIPYPPAGGYLEIRVYNGVYLFDDTDVFSSNASESKFYQQGLYDKIRWLLYKVPEVTVVKRTLTFDEAEVDDVEYSGVCNVNAKEELALETICGTLAKPCATAKGVLLRTSTGQQLSQFKRAGRTESAEQLLIGTMYSQFAARKTVLAGEIVLDSGGLTLYSEAVQPSGTKFLMTGELQHIRENMTEATLLEVRPDEYTAE